MARDPYTQFQQAMRGVSKLKRGRIGQRAAPAPKPAAAPKPTPRPVMAESRPLATVPKALREGSITRTKTSPVMREDKAINHLLDKISFNWEPEL